MHGRIPESLVLVDGTQHAPHGPIDVESMGIDAYFFAPYKTFSVPGGAFAWLSDRMAAKEHPRLEGAGLERWEMGTRDPSGFAAWSAVTDYLAWLGAEAGEKAEDRRTRVVAAMRAIEAHEAVLAEQVIAGLRELQGTHLHGVPVADARREAVFAVSVEGKAAAEVVAALGRHAGGNGTPPEGTGHGGQLTGRWRACDDGVMLFPSLPMAPNPCHWEDQRNAVVHPRDQPQ